MSKTFKDFAEACWDSHKQVGTKISSRTGKRVPNCVPKNEERTPAAGDKSFDIMRLGGANSPYNADGTPKKKSWCDCQDRKNFFAKSAECSGNGYE